MDESVQEHLKPELDEASRVLLKAADYIERHGWCQNEMRSFDGRVCMVGAVFAAHGGYEASVAWNRLQEAFAGLVGTWNDTPGRTQEEVVAKLRAVALSRR